MKERILICDNDAATCSKLAAILTKQGYDVRTVSAGKNVLDLARSDTFHLILLDPLIPDVSGWEVAAALRSGGETRHIPIVVVSVLAPSDVEFPAQVNGWVEKPVDAEKLFQVVEGALSSTPRRPMQILLVEDEDLPAGILKALFERNGVTSYRARNGVEAIDMASWIRPDLLVLDVRLPEIDGYNVIKWLRKHDALRNTPVVIYSGTEISPADKERLELGPTELIIKGRLPITAVEQKGMKLLAASVAAANLTVN